MSATKTKTIRLDANDNLVVALEALRANWLASIDEVIGWLATRVQRETAS